MSLRPLSTKAEPSWLPCHLSVSRSGRPERRTTFWHELTGGTPGTLYRFPSPGVVDGRPVLVQKSAVPVLAVIKVARDDGRPVPLPSLVGSDGEHVAVVQLDLQVAEELGDGDGLARALEGSWEPIRPPYHPGARMAPITLSPGRSSSVTSIIWYWARRR